MAALAFLALAVVASVVPLGRVPNWAAVGAVATVGVGLGPARTATVGDAVDALWKPLAFLLVAVPLAALLDEVGFFAAVAARIDGGRRLGLGLWWLAAVVTVVFNLDAAVVLLTPLYVRVAHRRGQDPVILAFIPALLASLASSVLPVSNLTNLIAAERLDLSAADFVRQLALPSLAAVAVGWWCFRPLMGTAAPTDDAPPDAALAASGGARPLVIGGVATAWLLVGFTAGEHLGVPAFAVAGAALVALAALTRSRPWRQVAFGPAVLALGLAVMAIAAAPELRPERLLSHDGPGGEVLAISGSALGATVMNNLPTTVVALPALETHPDRIWAVLLGVNLGPVLWMTGALSTLLWQACLRGLGARVGAVHYARVGWRVGLPALVAATVVRVLLA